MEKPYSSVSVWTLTAIVVSASRRCGPSGVDAYTVASREDMPKTVQEYRERLHKAEVDAENSEKALIAAEHQMGASVSQHEQVAASTQTYQSTQLTEKLCATVSTVNELQQGLANTQGPPEVHCRGIRAGERRLDPSSGCSAVEDEGL